MRVITKGSFQIGTPSSRMKIIKSSKTILMVICHNKIFNLKKKLIKSFFNKK